MMNANRIMANDPADSQFRNRFSFSFGLLAKWKVEKAIGNKFSLGLLGKVHTSRLQTGLKFDFFSRFYPEGVFRNFYFQPKFSFGKHEIFMVYSNVGGGTTFPYNEIEETYNNWVAGLGIDIGFIIPLSKNHEVFLDVNGGYNYYPFPKEIPLEFAIGNYNYIPNETVNGTGPFSLPKEIGPVKWNNLFTGAGAPFKLSITIGWII